MKNLRRNEFPAFSFSEADYEGALVHLPFRGLATRADFEEKYFYAGSSGRYMFAMSTDEVIDDIKLHVRRVGDVLKVLTAVEGDASEHAVGHLRSQFQVDSGIHTSVVSNYAVRLLVEKSNLEGVEMIEQYAQAANNGPMKGWAFEARFDAHLRFALRNGNNIRLVQAGGETCDDFPGKFPVEEIVRYETLETIGNGKVAARARAGSSLWLVPKRFNEGAFDFVWLNFVEGKVHVWTFNTTIAQSHDVKYANIRALIRRLVGMSFQVTVHRHVFVLPSEEKCIALSVVKNSTLSDHVGLVSAVLKAHPVQ
jgi:hypothetical protein